MTTVYKTANTPEGGVIVRRLHHVAVGSEEAWRSDPGGFAHAIGHKGPWLRCQWVDIPEAVRLRFRAAS